MKHRIAGVILWDDVFPIDYAKFSSIFKWVLSKAQQVQDTAQSLQRQTEILHRIMGTFRLENTFTTLKFKC